KKKYMTYDLFTLKAQEAIAKAQQITEGLQQQSVDTPHLLKGILETDGQLVEFLMKQQGVNMPVMRAKLDEVVRQYPKVQGTDKEYLSNDSNKALNAAKGMLKEYGDEYISLELILLAILKGNDRGARLLKELGATESGMKAAIAEL